MAVMVDWHALRDAYGSAEVIAELLERGDTDRRDIWEELWSRLCHQGTVYTASYAALPRLAELARRRDPSGFVEPLFLATSIIASTDVPRRRMMFAHATPTRSVICMRLRSGWSHWRETTLTSSTEFKP